MQKPGRLAIVGISFRFPGPGGDQFWNALCEGRDLVTSVDNSRWAQDAYLHPSEDEPGRTYTFAAGSVGDVSGFDAAFFGISPREAANVDPQQRLLLELTWEALESGGIRPSTLRGSRTGVLIGFSGSDYGYRHVDDLDAVDGFYLTGCSASIAANRVSYFYDLRGPSLALDTACSSAMTAFHFACQSVLSGESDMAVTGAVNLHLHPLAFIAFSKASMLARRGRSRAFDASGDGYVRSEGCAIALVKRLEDAVRDGNRIYAVVAGSAVNCDGKTNGLTVPSVEAQSSLLKEVYTRAGIAPAEIDYLEAHGTGTSVGDPIEARALGEALGRARPEGNPLRIGSIKTNVGHMETVAGMAGLVKAVYCLQKRAVPGSLHFETPNPRIPFADLNLEVVRELQPLDAHKRLVIGVNSFGFGGANGHVILESPPPAAPRAAPAPSHAVPLLLSGKSDKALAASARAFADTLRRREDSPIYDIAYAAAYRRDWLRHRAVFFVADRADAIEQLSAFADGLPGNHVASGTALENPVGPVFVYSGNGAQWAGMGRKLFEEEPLFRASMERVDALFQRHSGRSIIALMHAADIEAGIESTEIAQPLLFAVQVGITETLRAWGVAPAAVFGHSVGEIAAAWASGALALEDAVRIVFHRSAWQGRTRGAGGMSVVRATVEEVQALMATLECGPRLAIAAVNAPTSLTVAGPKADLDALEMALGRLGKGNVRLALDYAFHSAAMDTIEAGVLASLADLKPRAAAIPFFSAVSGEVADGATLGAGYWWRNIRESVRFSDGMAALRAQGHSVFLEIGPKAILAGYMADCIGASVRECRILPTMAIGHDGVKALRKRAFEVAAAGCALDLARYFPVPAPDVDLPGYAWQRERHWHEPSPGSHGVVRRQAPHPLLGHRLREGGMEWESRLDTARLPAYADHRVGGEVIFPAAGFAEMALAACAALREGDAREVEDLTIHAPLVLEAERSKTLQLAVDADDGRITIRSRATSAADGWRLHASGRLPLLLAAPPAPEELALPASGAISADAHYAALASMQLEYGPAFRAVDRVYHCGPKLVVAELAAQPVQAAQAQLEPSVLDACFQLIVHLQAPDPDSGELPAFVPVRIGRLSVVRPGERIAFALLRETQRGPRSAEVNCVLYGADRRPVAVAHDVRFRALPRREASQLIAMRERAIAKPLARRRSGALLAPAARLGAGCLARLHAPARLVARRRYYEVVDPLLEAMLSAFARQALAALDSAQLSSPRERLWLDRIRALAGSVDLPQAEVIWSELMADCTDHSAEVLELGRIGSHFADLARGGEFSVAAAGTADFGDALARFTADAIASLPAGERLRVLVLERQDSDLGVRIATGIDTDRADCVVSRDAAGLDAQPRFDLVIWEQEGAGHPARELARIREYVADAGLLATLVSVPGRATAIAGSIVDAGDAAGAGVKDPAEVRAQWRRDLSNGGFVEEVLLEDLPGNSGGPFVLIARAPVRDQAETARHAGGAWLIAARATGESQALAENLRSELASRGRPAMIVKADATVAWAGVLREALAAAGELAGIVDLPVTGRESQTRSGRALVDRQVDRCASLGELFEACNAAGLNAETWVVTARCATALLPQAARSQPPEVADAAVWGFVRSACNEYPGLPLRLADLASPDSQDAVALLADSLVQADGEDEIILADTGRYALRVDATPVARLRPETAAPVRESTTLEIAVPGQLRNLGWIRRPLRALADDEVEIDVRAAGLNFRDVMFAMGQLSEEALEAGFAGLTLGMEHAGVVAAAGSAVKTLAPGDRVLAFAGASFGTRVVTRAGFVLKMPDAWSFEAAATVPAAFLTAHYALTHLARLQEGERVLIHGAAGGVGMAALQIARNAGAEIFATAGTDAKRDIVRLLGADHVLDSRTLDFAGEILARTGGEGVDVVLNSLAGEAMLRSLQVVRPLGRFLELGKRDYYENSRIGLRPFRNNISYYGIDLDQLMRERPAFARRMMHDLLAQFEEGALSPLPYRAFAAADAESAFRFMQQSHHVGKIVLRMDPAPKAASAAPVASAPLRLPATASYLVTGGLGGFGLRTARWLADRGARHLVLLGRSAPGAQATKTLAALTAAGVNVRVEQCDVASHGDLQKVLQSVRADMPPLRGIVHAAGVFRDGLIRNLDRRSIEEVLLPKVLGALNLHRLTQDVPLDFFVLYSSATTTFGSPGQANYVAGNRFLEVLAGMRRARRLPALCVGWGPIADAGYLERNPEIRAQVAARMGDSAVSSAQALEALERLLADDASGLTVMKVSRASLGRLATVARAARFSELATLAGDVPPSVEAGEIERWLAELDDAGLTAMLADQLCDEAAEVLRLPAEKLDVTQQLQELGFDSLMGVELITAIEARFGVSLPVVAVNEIGTLEKLAARLVKELRRERPPAAAPADALDAQARRLAALHAKGMAAEQVEGIASAVRRGETAQARPA